MKQLLIVNSSAKANGGLTAPTDLSGMEFGGFAAFYPDATSFLSSAPTKDFALALGRGKNSPAFVIPEVDFKSLTVTVAEPKTGVAYKAEVTIPTVATGSTYTLVLVKNGTVPHERNTWTATETIPVGTTSTSAAIAEKLGKYFQRMADTGSLNVKVTVASAKITIEGLIKGEAFTLKAADALSGVTITETRAEKATGDKAYVEDLASRCAAGKGFNDTYQDGDSIYPGYPEPVEDTTYKIVTLRFAVGRKASKTRDEVVYQLVHIAVPTTSSQASTIVGMFADLNIEESSEE